MSLILLWNAVQRHCRRVGRLMVVGLPVAALGGCTSATTAELPTIVVVTIDTIRADHLGAYGYFRDTSPQIDAFAARAVVFENAVTPMATTLPAHVSLMTSTYTTTHGIKGNLAHMGSQFDGEAGLRPIAASLSDLDYATAAFVSATPLADHTDIQAGFQHFDQPVERERRAAATIDLAIDWLDNDDPRPRFLWVHLWDPHAPYAPPPETAGAFGDEPGLRDVLAARGIDVGRRAIRMHNNYDAEILYTDRQIGRLFGALQARDMWADAAVVIVGDHGEGLGQHDWRDHGRIYNEQLFVPLIVKFPEDAGLNGRRVDTLVSTIDTVPTLVGQLGIPLADNVTARFEGVDMLGDAVAGRDYVLAERSHREREWGPGLKYALVSPRFKYLHLTEGDDELYDMQTDRGETDNVIAAYPEVAANMLEVVEAVLAAEISYSQGEIPADRLEALRALGYLR